MVGDKWTTLEKNSIEGVLLLEQDRRQRLECADGKADDKDSELNIKHRLSRCATG